MTYLTPKVDGDGKFKGDLTPLGMRIDASGGWWDAGDYLKFVQTTGYTVAVLLTGVRDFPAQMGRAPADPRAGSASAGSCACGTTARARSTTRSGSARATTRSWATTTSGGCRRPTTPTAGSDPTYRYIRHRPVFRAGPPGSPVSPNLAGRDAAAFALCYQVFHPSDPAFAARCLAAGRHIFDLADTHPKGHLVTVVPFDFYPESEWRDDLELGATELALGHAAPRGRRRSCPTCAWPRTGRTPTSTGRTTPPTRSTSTT